MFILKKYSSGCNYNGNSVDWVEKYRPSTIDTAILYTEFFEKNILVYVAIYNKEGLLIYSENFRNSKSF